MFSRFLVVCLFFAASVGVCEDSNFEPLPFINDVIDSFNKEDCEKFSSFFVKAEQQKKRRDAGILFATNNISMTLRESHVIFESDSKIEVAVHYSMDNNDVYSRLFFRKEEEGWKIEKEVFIKPNSKVQISNTRYTPVRPQPQTQTQSGCSNGRCGGPTIPFSSLEACREYGFENIPCR